MMRDANAISRLRAYRGLLIENPPLREKCHGARFRGDRLTILRCSNGRDGSLVECLNGGIRWIDAMR